jgi:hypothetical protein
MEEQHPLFLTQQCVGPFGALRALVSGVGFEIFNLKSEGILCYWGFFSVFVGSPPANQAKQRSLSIQRAAKSSLASVQWITCYDRSSRDTRESSMLECRTVLVVCCTVRCTEFALSNCQCAYMHCSLSIQYSVSMTASHDRRSKIVTVATTTYDKSVYTLVHPKPLIC